jgi:hypothetical protein
VDDAASLSAISAQSTTPNTATGAIAFTFNDPDGAVCTSARLSVSSTNTTLIPNANVVWAGTAPNCTATITPATDKTGTSTITITATDGGLSSKTVNFTLSVTGPLLRWEYTGSTITTYDIGSPGGTTTRTFQLRNFGNAVTSVTPVISDDAGSNKISQSNNCSAPLSANGACDVVVTWDNGGGPGARTEVYTGTAGSISAAMTFTGTK